MTTLYTTSATALAGRNGQVTTDDKKLDLGLSYPKEMGGSGEHTNPEQLFAAGYSACFIGAMKFVAGAAKISLPSDLSLRAEVGIGKVEGGFGLDVDLFVNLPGMDKAAADELVAKAHQVCPYSNATRGNIDVRLHVSV